MPPVHVPRAHAFGFQRARVWEATDVNTYSHDTDTIPFKNREHMFEQAQGRIIGLLEQRGEGPGKVRQQA